MTATLSAQKFRRTPGSILLQMAAIDALARRKGTDLDRRMAPPAPSLRVHIPLEPRLRRWSCSRCIVLTLMPENWSRPWSAPPLSAVTPSNGIAVSSIRFVLGAALGDTRDARRNGCAPLFQSDRRQFSRKKSADPLAGHQRPEPGGLNPPLARRLTHCCRCSAYRRTPGSIRRRAKPARDQIASSRSGRSSQLGYH
jgi:hypothetical protein